jgi:hypothetical protein
MWMTNRSKKKKKSPPEAVTQRTLTVERSLNDEEKTRMLHLRYKPHKRNKLHVPHSYLFLVRRPSSAQRINTPQTAEEEEEEEEEEKSKQSPNLVGMGSSSGTISSLLS